jgi:hypothetical protein
MTAPLRLLATGSRDLADRPRIWQALDALAAHYAPRPLLLVHGGCPDGFDAEADAWALSRGIQREPHPADWDSCAWDCPPEPHRRLKRPGDTAHPGMLADYCPTAGPRRNALMVGLGAELVVAAPVGRSFGTRNCMRLAREAGIRVDSLDGWVSA